MSETDGAQESQFEDPKPQSEGKPKERTPFIAEEITARVKAAEAYRELIVALLPRAKRAMEIFDEAMGMELEDVQSPEDDAEEEEGRGRRRSRRDSGASLKLAWMRMRLGAATKTLQATRQFLGRGATGASDAESEPEDERALQELSGTLS